MAGTRDALVFDLDGTLVDSLPDLLAAMNRLLAELGRAKLAAAALRAMIGDGASNLVGQAMAATGQPVAPAELPALTQRYLDHYGSAAAVLTRAYPRVPQTLAQLSRGGYRHGICTNKPQRETDILLAALKLDRHFLAALGADSVARRKPDPDHLKATLERMDATPARAVMIGDSYNDLATARALGVPCILMRYGYSRLPVDALGADRVLDDFAELPQAIAEL